MRLRQLGLLALQFPFLPSDRHAFSAPQPENVALEFGQGSEDVEEHLAHRVGRIVDYRSELELQPAFHQLVGDGPCIRHRASRLSLKRVT